MPRRASSRIGFARCETVRQRQAFTLIEIVIVIAIIGLATAALLSGLSMIMPGDQKDSPREVLRKAVDAAWYASATGHGRFSLNYDEEANALVVRPFASGVATADDAEEEFVGSDSGDSGNTDDSDDAEPALSENADSGNSPGNESVQTFPFNDDRVTAVHFTRAPDTGNGSLQATTDISYPRLQFSPWGGATPAVIELEIAGEVYRYRLEVFGGALEDLKE
jgi:prepilin-type N-terminal cleavage/methylation domain-containing protein